MVAAPKALKYEEVYDLFMKEHGTVDNYVRSYGGAVTATKASVSPDL